jgi:hypothetical protein
VTEKPRLVSLPTVTNPQGDLTFVDGDRILPFAIRRAYYVHGIPETAVRGGHANKSNEQLLIALAGGFDVKLESQLGAASHFRLESPTEGLLIPRLHWIVIDNFEPGSICLALASEPYDAASYLRDYEAFRAWGRSRR